MPPSPKETGGGRSKNDTSTKSRGQNEDRRPHHMQPARPRQPHATGTGRPAYATMAVPRLPITSWRRAMSITFLASTRVGTSMRRRSPALLTT